MIYEANDDSIKRMDDSSAWVKDVNLTIGMSFQLYKTKEEAEAAMNEFLQKLQDFLIEEGNQDHSRYNTEPTAVCLDWTKEFLW